MLYIYIKTQNALVQRINFNLDSQELPQNILWIDLLHPSAAEIAFISSEFNLEFPTKEEREEIELSAKYWEFMLMNRFSHNAYELYLMSSVGKRF